MTLPGPVLGIEVCLGTSQTHPFSSKADSEEDREKLSSLWATNANHLKKYELFGSRDLKGISGRHAAQIAI